MARKQRFRNLAVGAALMFITALGWVSHANAYSSYYGNNCSGCHGTSPDTCSGCHAHGTHSSSGKSNTNVSATSDKSVYAPGETVNVAITGGYRPGWVRVKLWDKDCAAVSCSSNDYIEVQGTMATGISADFPGPVTLSHAAPATAGTYTWSASWYGNDYEQSGAAFGALWLPDTGNFNHGDEIVTFTFQVAGRNTPPVANADSVRTAVNAPLDIDVLANDTDADGDTLRVNSFDSTSANGGSVSCSLSANTPAPQCAYTPAPNACGADSFTYNATDGNDGSNRATVTIQVGDANAPNVTAPAELTITLPAGSGVGTTVPASDVQIANWLDAASASDAEEGAIAVTNNAPGAFAVGSTPVTFTASDSCGNTASAAANVSVLIADNATPMVTAPSPDPLRVTAPLCATSVSQAATADNFAGTIGEWLLTATATDAEDGDLSVSHGAPASFDVGDTLITFSATDSIGATGEATTTVSVAETPNTAPVVTAPTQEALVITLPLGTAAGATVPVTDPAIADWLALAGVTDAEDGTVTLNHDAPAEFPVGTTVVTFSATDGCGLTAEASASVTVEVQGNTTPVVTAPDPLTVDAPLCAASVSADSLVISSWLGSASAMDAEDGMLFPGNDAPADFPIGKTTVGFSATDSAGAMGAATTSVTVNSANSAPAVTAPASLMLTVPAGTASVPVSDPQIAAWLASASAMDAEDGSLNVSHDAPSDFALGTVTVTFTASDGCGLSASASAAVTIQQEAAVNDDTEEFEEGGNARVSKPLEADRPGKRNGEGRGSGRAKGRAERGIGLPPFPER